MKIQTGPVVKVIFFLTVLLLLFLADIVLLRLSYNSTATWLSVFGVLFITAGGIFIAVRFIKLYNRLRKDLEDLSLGIIPETGKEEGDDISGIEQALDIHIERVRGMVAFSKRLAEGELEQSVVPASDKDEMANALNALRNSLLTKNKEARKRQEEDEQRNWSARGIALFNEILRETGDDVSKFSFTFIKALVNYIGVEAGGLYLVEEDKKIDGKKVLRLTGCFAFDREKYEEKEILFGEGLAGRTAVEREMIYLTDLPGEYLKIRSGLGEDEPVALLLVPVIQSDEVLGVIELASFTPFPDYKIGFVKSLGESIGSIISKLYANLQTEKLLRQSQKNSEELIRREEEMKMSMEELRKIQEATALREQELIKELERLIFSTGKFDGIKYNITDILSVIL